MKENTRELCDDILRYGIIFDDETFTHAGNRVRRYEIWYEGETYVLVKVNGEWKHIYKIVETSNGVYYKVIE